jgi:hypothetical protein
MRRYPSLTWEYRPKTREILAARNLAAFLEQEVDIEECEEVALSLLPNDPEEVSGKEAEIHPREGREGQTTTGANQGQEAEQIACWEG